MRIGYREQMCVCAGGGGGGVHIGFRADPGVGVTVYIHYIS